MSFGYEVVLGLTRRELWIVFFVVVISNKALKGIIRVTWFSLSIDWEVWIVMIAELQIKPK